MNNFSLVASIIERDILRYTPAGIPVVSGKLSHNSQQLEAGVFRQVECEMDVMAAGKISLDFSNVELGSTLTFSGFLAKKNRNSKALIFHITEFS